VLTGAAGETFPTRTQLF